MAPQMGLIGFYIAQGYKIAYMALLGPFWPVGILLKRYNEVILRDPLGRPQHKVVLVVLNRLSRPLKRQSRRCLEAIKTT